MSAYYNEIDSYAAQWLRNLIKAGHIADGVVDERSIEDVTPNELREFKQCHFFAGIGVWSYALRGAGWSDDIAAWTGSCPCQPFSEAGKGAGFNDERHLWPAWQHLIAECRPPIILGEQVASKNSNPWIDLVQDDLEGMDYAFGAVAFPSASVGAPHIRDRSYWVANSNGGERNGLSIFERNECNGKDTGWTQKRSEPESRIDVCERPGPTNGFWRNSDWLACTDGKWRPVEPGTSPLAYGSPNRVGRLRAYGNAINAEAAKVFIETVMENFDE